MTQSISNALDPQDSSIPSCYLPRLLIWPLPLLELDNLGLELFALEQLGGLPFSLEVGEEAYGGSWSARSGGGLEGACSLLMVVLVLRKEMDGFVEIAGLYTSADPASCLGYE